MTFVVDNNIWWLARIVVYLNCKVQCLLDRPDEAFGVPIVRMLDEDDVLFVLDVTGHFAKVLVLPKPSQMNSTFGFVEIQNIRPL